MPRTTARFLLLAALGVASLALAPIACSPSSDTLLPDQADAAGAGGGATAGSGGGSTSSSESAGGSIFDGGPSDGGLTPDTACAHITEKANATPLNLYIMFDKSSSMVGDKWTSAKKGLATFVKAPKSAGIRVGLRFFPRDPDAVPACDQKAYKDPTVPFGELPENADAIIAAIEAESPNGFSTPIYPALGGAILGGIEVAKNNPGEVAAVLLVTDGEPQGPAGQCAGVDPEDPAVIAELASIGAKFDPPVRTYVIGLPGVNQAVANQIASAGDSKEAILVANVNVEAEFEKALEKVLGKALPCEYLLSEQVVTGEVAPNKVNIQITSSASGSPESHVLPQNQACDGPGWTYDDPIEPSLIVLCPATCADIKADLTAKIDILLGCETEVAK